MEEPILDKRTGERLPPLSIEQAANYIAKKSETIAEDIKKEVKSNPISFASPADRQRFLIYGLSILDDVSESMKCRICAVLNKPPALYSTKEIAQNCHRLLTLRINGYSLQQIAHHLKLLPEVVEKAEQLAVEAVSEAIERKKATGLPILGGARV